MRQLVVCCDGTWNTPEEEAATNVARLHNALADTAEDGTEQLRYYDRGVGTEGGLIDFLLGGTAGVGLARNVLDAYYWLTTTYQPGDRIALFGFSRGAYTVRSLAGMISACGLLDTAALDDAMTWRRIEYVYHRRYRRGERASPHWRHGLRFGFDPEHADRIPVHFIGVWDTVGNLGIPDNLGVLNLLDSPRRYEFHDVRLNPHIRHARHALALDEQRGPFTPTLWSDPAPGQDLEQVWFPGSHLDVGGGHRDKGLSDGALQWMIEQARETAGLAFRKTTLEQIRPDPLDILHKDQRLVTGWFGPALEPVVEPFFAPRPRAVPPIDPRTPDPQLDASVYERHQNPPITGGRYRTTRMLSTGESATVRVHARDPWNWTGLYLEPGTYTLAAQGQWADRHLRSGPGGTTGLRRFRPAEAGRMLGTVIGQGEKLFRRVIGNQVADFLATRREEDLPWMSLVGVIANSTRDDAPNEHERIAVGTGTDHRVTAGGHLYAFANDAWGYYGNNRGSVRLTVTRTA